jgi:hypothetical protein
MIKKFFNEIVGTLSLLVTTFFGIYGIFHLNDAKHERERFANIELIGEVQELVFNNEIVDCQDLATLIRGKEIKNDIVYPFSIGDLLIQCQENIFSAKYLRLENREILFEKFDSIKILNNECIKSSSPKMKYTFFAHLSWIKIISILALVISGLLAFNLISNIKEKIKRNLSEKYSDYEEQSPKYSSDGLKYEETILNIFKKLNIEVLSRGSDYGFDTIIRVNEKEYIVETKYVKQNITLSTLKGLFNVVKKSKMDMILISNYIMNFESFSALSDFNEKAEKGKIYYISGFTEDQLEKEIRSITGKVINFDAH